MRQEFAFQNEILSILSDQPAFCKIAPSYGFCVYVCVLLEKSRK